MYGKHVWKACRAGWWWSMVGRWWSMVCVDTITLTGVNPFKLEEVQTRRFCGCHNAWLNKINCQFLLILLLRSAVHPHITFSSCGLLGMCLKGFWTNWLDWWTIRLSLIGFNFCVLTTFCCKQQPAVSNECLQSWIRAHCVCFLVLVCVGGCWLEL